MGNVVEFVPKSELERLRLIREARAIYNSIFPPADAVGDRPDHRGGKGEVTEPERPAHATSIWMAGQS
jgi:hypothetical protein